MPPPRQPVAVPTTEAARRVELASQFARELRSGRRQLSRHAHARRRWSRECVAVAGEARRADGRGRRGHRHRPRRRSSTRSSAPASPSSAPRPAPTTRRARELRGKLARCDLAVAEADYAIASTGTLAVVATPERPGSLTLLPPVNVILVSVDRILPDLAAALAAIGPASHREPSRDADHRPEPHRRYRKAHRARRPRPARDSRHRGMAAR